MDWIIMVAGGGLLTRPCLSSFLVWSSTFHALNRLSVRCPEPELPAQIQTFCSWTRLGAAAPMPVQFAQSRPRAPPASRAPRAVRGAPLHPNSRCSSSMGAH